MRVVLMINPLTSVALLTATIRAFAGGLTLISMMISVREFE